MIFVNRQMAKSTLHHDRDISFGVTEIKQCSESFVDQPSHLNCHQ